MPKKFEYVGDAGLLTIFNLIKTELGKYVLAVNGKGLSDENFTAELKTLLESVESGAQVNVQADWNQTTTTADDYIKNKPTIDNALSSVSENAVQNKVINTALSLLAPLANPTFTGTVTVPDVASGDNTGKAANTKFVTAAITTAIGQITGIVFDADTSGAGYTSLTDLQTKHPTGEAGHIYLVQNSGSAPNAKDEYFWNSVSSSYELFGTTAISLDGYAKEADFGEIAAADITAAWNTVFNVSAGGGGEE